MFLFPPAVATEKENHQEMSCTTWKGRFQRLSRLVKVWPVLRASGMRGLFRFYRFSYSSAVELFPLMTLVCAELNRHEDAIWCYSWPRDSSFLFYTPWCAYVCTGTTGVSGALYPSCPRSLNVGTAHSPGTAAVQVPSKAWLHNKTSWAKKEMESHTRSMKWARAKGGAQQGERRSESLLTSFPRAPGIRAEGGFPPHSCQSLTLYFHTRMHLINIMQQRARFLLLKRHTISRGGKLYPPLTLALMSTGNTKAEKFSLFKLDDFPSYCNI